MEKLRERLWVGWPVRRVSPGEVFRPPSASEHNAIVNATELTARQDGVVDSADPKRRWINPFQLIAKNTSGSAKRRGEVCQLARTPIVTNISREAPYANATDPWQGGVSLYPTGRYLPRQFGVWLDPCPNLGYARVQIAGVCEALVYVNDVQDNFCDVEIAEDRLISTTAGDIQIITKPTGLTGEQTCLVNLSRQEESHLVGVPVGNGITACAGTPGQGVVALYFQDAGAFYAVLEPDGVTPVYLTVYSLHDDPIIPNTINAVDGYPYTPGYGTAEFCLLHRDEFGTWWIDPMPHAKVGVLHLTGAGTGAIGPSATAYLARNTALGDGGTGITNLDNVVLTATDSPSPGDEGNGVARVNLTGDYTVTLSWYGGTYTSSNAPYVAGWPTTAPWGVLAFAQVTLTLQYLPPGGSWTTLIYSPAERRTDGAGNYLDNSGASYTTSIYLTAGTLLRCAVTIGTQYPSGTPSFNPYGMIATVNIVKHA